METVLQILEQRVSEALEQASGLDRCNAIVRPAAEARFGDYQVNGVMALAKQLKANPRELAQQVVEYLQLQDICEDPEVAGPGFINLRLRRQFVAEMLGEIYQDHERLGIDKVAKSRTFVVDFSSPNVAKQMHVGHLRSTIIGDCICRLLEFVGHRVIRQNHIGDWGTHFGMLIQYMYEQKMQASAGADKPAVGQSGLIHISDLEEFYRQAKAKFDTDADFAKAAKQRVVELHKKEPRTIQLWREIVDESRRHFQPIYEQLGVKLCPEDERGESFYAEMLGQVVEELKNKGLAVESEGAVCVFVEGFRNKQGQPLPFIIQKSDGAYLYATTDLAALRYRVRELGAEAVLYVTDARQKLHFEMLFSVARLAGWVGDDVELTHVMFGSVLGEDGRPLKTRSGQNVKLKDLLEEAIERARVIVEQKNPDLPSALKERIARAVGIGAVKYADYSNNRTSDYVFSFDKMLAMEGNTAPYMQYAYARVQSIRRKAESKGIDVQAELGRVESVELAEPAEFELGKQLLRYGEAVEVALNDYRPNYLTNYLYELAQKFSVFYTQCPVLEAPPPLRGSRLMLCDLTARTIHHGLVELLGIEVVEQM